MKYSTISESISCKENFFDFCFSVYGTRVETIECLNNKITSVKDISGKEIVLDFTLDFWSMPNEEGKTQNDSIQEFLNKYPEKSKQEAIDSVLHEFLSEFKLPEKICLCDFFQEER